VGALHRRTSTYTGLKKTRTHNHAPSGIRILDPSVRGHCDRLDNGDNDDNHDDDNTITGVIYLSLFSETEKQK
jgi:hypothetical protein